MKKIIIIILCILIIGFSSFFVYDKFLSNNNHNTEHKEINMKDIYLELKNNKRKIITSSGEYLLDEYLSNSNYGEKSNDYEYAFVDFDSDGILEIIFYYGFGISLIHYENNILYGYDKVTYMNNIKTDGTFIGRTDDNGEAFLSISFNKKTYNKNVLAYDQIDKYVINNKEVTESEYNAYLNNHEKKQGLEYIYVYNNEEYSSTEFSNIVDNLNDKKNQYEENVYKVLELYNGPGYGSGTDFCGDVDDNSTIFVTEEAFIGYSLSKKFKTKEEVYDFWREYLSDEFINNLSDDLFIEKDGKLYCSQSGKDGGVIYNKKTTKFMMKNEKEDKFTIIGRVFYKDSMGFDEFDERSYTDVIFNFIKNAAGNFVIDNYVKYSNHNSLYS